jgi:hypothetical protein
MWKRFFIRTALLGLMLILPVVAPAADGPAGKPALILSVASYEQLRADFFYLARLAGQDENAARIDALIEAQAGDGLAGIDRKKPMGGYGWVGAHGDDSAAVLLVPVADQTAFLSLLEHFNITARRGGDGVYSANVEQVPEPVFFRFANGYAYVTIRDKSVLADDRLLAPGVVLTGQGCAGTDQKPDSLVDYWTQNPPADRLCRNTETNVLTMIFNVDRVPDEFKDMLLEEFDLELSVAKVRDAPLFETEMQKKLRLLTIDEIARGVRTLIREGGEESLRLDLDRRAGDIALTYSVEGKPGSSMAAAIQDLGQARSTMAGLVRRDAAFNIQVNESLPEKLRETFAALLDDGRQQALANAKDLAERASLAMVFDAIMPTAKAAELDYSVSMLGPSRDGLYTIVGGLKVKDGGKLERAVRATAPAAVQKDPTTEVRFDVDKAGPVGIHRVTFRTDEEWRRIFGDSPLHFAFRNDAVLVAMGPDALGVLKDALAVTPTMGKVTDLQFAVSRLAPLSKDRRGEAKEIARRVFTDDRDDRFRLTLEGGQALKLRLAMKTKLIEFFSRVGQAMNAR